MKKVMLLGDSIRMFYQNEVKRLLGEEYTVWSPEENCKFAKYTLNTLREWLPNCPNPDIIHWNNGLWDIAILYKEDGCFTQIDDYIETMAKILRELKKTGARIIFATTTPVNPEKSKLSGPMPPSNNNADIIRYNQKAVELMENNNIEINDLFSIVYPHIYDYICEDLIHPTDTGIKACATAVAKAIML